MTSFSAEIIIRFSDIDGFGHVNHAKYLTYCEDHRTVMFNQMGEDTGSRLNMSGFSVVSIECHYRAAVYLEDEVVNVQCSVEKIGTTSVGLRYELSLSTRQVVVADMLTTIVLTENGKPRPVTPAERSWLQQFYSAA
jgi:acyl-CoA thioester hydrolase